MEDKQTITSLPPVESLLRDSWELLKGTWKKLLVFNLVMLVVVLLAFTVLIIAGFITVGGSALALSHGNFSAATLSTLGAGVLIFVILFIVLAFMVSSIYQAGNMLAISEPSLGIQALIRKASHFALPLFGLSVMFFILAVPTLFLFIIPFFFVILFLYFAPYALVIGNYGVLQSLRRSAYLVKVNFTAMLVRALLMVGLFILVGIVTSLLGSIFARVPVFNFLLAIVRTVVDVVLGWFVIVYSLNLYKQAEATVPDKTKEVKLIWFAILSLVSFVLAIVVAGAIIKAISSNPEVKAVINSAKTSSSTTGGAEGVVKQAYKSAFVASCKQSASLSDSYCTCIADNLVKNYSATQLQEISQKYTETKAIPKEITQAADSCNPSSK